MYLEYVKNSCNTIRQTSPVPKCGKGSNTHFTTADIYDSPKKRCAMSLVIGEMQTTTKRCHFTPTRRAKMEKAVTSKCW